MTGVEAGQLTGTEILRFTMRLPTRGEPPAPALMAVSTTFRNLDALFTFAAIVTFNRRGVSEVNLTKRQPSLIAQGQIDARGKSSLIRISYNSPLEIWLSIGGGAVGVGTLLRYTQFGSKIIDLYEKFQHARVTKSDADVKVVANRILLEELNSILRQNQTKRDQAVDRIDQPETKVEDFLTRGDYTSELIERASWSLESIEQIQIEND